MKQAITAALLGLCLLVPQASAGEGERDHHDRGHEDRDRRPYEHWHRVWFCDYYNHCAWVYR